MDISCAFPPVPQTPEHIALAERLGYRRAWVYDTPALQLDVWMTLARAAERTKRIDLGPGVLIPSLRHVLTTAAAIATLVDLAPGRVNVGIGSGFTGRMAMGQRPNPWAFVAEYARQLKALLAGDMVEVDGALTRMLHGPGRAVKPLRGPTACLLLAPSLAFRYHRPAMEPADPTASPLRYRLAPNSQTACYSPWLKVRVLIRFALTTPWSGREWAEVKQHLPWLLAEELRLRRQGWLN